MKRMKCSQPQSKGPQSDLVKISRKTTWVPLILEAILQTLSSAKLPVASMAHLPLKLKISFNQKPSKISKIVAAKRFSLMETLAACIINLPLIPIILYPSL
jgi:hypothetical protein